MPEQIGTVLKVINRQLASLTMIVFQLFSKWTLWKCGNLYKPANSRAALLCPCIMAHPPSMVVQVTTPRDDILLNALHASSMLPHFAYTSTKLFLTKTSDSHPFWMICSWTHLPSSIATMLAQVLSTPTKVAEFGCTDSCCICWNSCSAFGPCQHFYMSQCHGDSSDHESWDGILLNTLQASLPHFAYMSIKLLPLKKTSVSQPLGIICSWTHLLLLHL